MIIDLQKFLAAERVYWASWRRCSTACKTSLNAG